MESAHLLRGILTKMRIISTKLLREFGASYVDARNPLAEWKRIARNAKWKTFDEVRLVFGKRVDRYKNLVIFDIGGNKYRLIAAIHYNTGIIYLRHMLTHAEYDQSKWKTDAK